jgi:hypothetical protein
MLSLILVFMLSLTLGFFKLSLTLGSYVEPEPRFLTLSLNLGFLS